jgi:alpha-N-arabinofuranosidase
LGTRYFLKDGLGVAAALNEYGRQSDIMFMANYAQTVNVIGAIKTTKTAAALETTGLVLKLYRRHFGSVPVKTVASRPLDALAAWSDDGKALTLAVVNPTLNQTRVTLNVEGAKLAGRATRWQIAGRPMDYNEPGRPASVVIDEQEVSDVETLDLPPCSLSMYRFAIMSPFAPRK